MVHRYRLRAYSSNRMMDLLQQAVSRREVRERHPDEPPGSKRLADEVEVGKPVGLGEGRFTWDSESAQSAGERCFRV